MGDLTGLLSDVVRALGFRCVTLLHHVDLARARTPVVAYSDYPMEHLSRSLARKYFADDPVLVVSERRNAPFFWSELPDLLALSPRHREILASAAQSGLEQGLTVPVNVPGEPRGSCSFGLAAGERPPGWAVQAVAWVGMCAFEEARRIVGLSDGRILRPALSPRQLECLVLCGQGKSYPVIAQILGLAPDTITEYMEGAMRRYQVSSRQQLIAACLASGQITYADVLL